MASVLLYGSTGRYPAVRHEIPLEIVDEVMFVDAGDAKYVLTSSLESTRITEVMPEASVSLYEDLGLFALVKDGVRRDLAELEVAVRALKEWGIDDLIVPADLPVALADRLRGEGLAVTVDGPAVAQRRRVKSPLELDGIRRAQRAAESGMAVAEELIHKANARDGILWRAGACLTAEIVRAEVRAACAAAGAPAPPDIMVVSLHSSGGHDPGSGPLPAGLPIEVDLWPRDERTGCWADMTRTFVGGEVDVRTADLRDIVRDAIEAARGAARAGVDGEDLYDAACNVIERAGYPTRRSAGPGEHLTRGFYFSLGHGVGLEIHEAPHLGLGTGEVLVPGDVIAIEPGIEGIEGVGGVRYEDLLLITADGCETLTQYHYDL